MSVLPLLSYSLAAFLLVLELLRSHSNRDFHLLSLGPELEEAKLLRVAGGDAVDSIGGLCINDRNDGKWVTGNRKLEILSERYLFIILDADS